MSKGSIVEAALNAISDYHQQPKVEWGVKWELTRAEYFRSKGDIDMAE